MLALKNCPISPIKQTFKQKFGDVEISPGLLTWEFALTPRNTNQIPSEFFRAIIDLGSSLHFAISEKHIVGCNLGPFRPQLVPINKKMVDFAFIVRDVNGAETPIPAYEGTLWMKNLDGDPTPIDLPHGFARYGVQKDSPRGPVLPLVGVGLLRHENACCVIDYHRHSFSFINFFPAVNFGRFLLGLKKADEVQLRRAYHTQLQEAHSNSPEQALVFLLKRFLDLPCPPQYAGEKIAKIVAEVGMQPNMAMPAETQVRKFCEILVSQNVGSQEDLERLLEQFEDQRRRV